VDELTHADLVAAANRMLPGRAPATLNRWVLRPAAAILHYAAENKYCEWLRVKLFEEPRPETRAARPATIAKLFDRTEGRQRLLVMWLYYQGTRITQTLSVDWPHVDLERAAFSFYDKKARRWQEFPLHADVLELLLLVPEAERVGRVFPWGDRHNVYRWLRPLVRELKITFTPHMARHALGTRLNADGAGLRTIMGALGHQDPRSSLRYQAAETEVVRAATAKIPRLRISGKRPQILENKQTSATLPRLGSGVRIPSPAPIQKLNVNQQDTWKSAAYRAADRVSASRNEPAREDRRSAGCLDETANR
jgi:integrase